VYSLAYSKERTTKVAGSISLPGLTDVHVHLRDPGQEHKEDFITGTSAALAGGFTTVIDMPNNAEPIFTVERLRRKIALAKQKVVCDIGFYFGSQGDNLDEFAEASQLALGLKLYLNHTTGNFLMDPEHLKTIYAAWPQDSPILLHAEEDVIDVVIESLNGLARPIHVCHMPSREILEKIIVAKKLGLPVTCGVCPHHLFLNDQDEQRIGVYGAMKPSLKPQSDVNYLWEHLDDIDMFESDHAPHTHQEKQDGAFGVPGLETMLPLLMTAVSNGKMTIEQLVDKLYTQPKKLLKLPDQEAEITFVGEPTVIDNNKLLTKCGWSPFDGMAVSGKVQKVILRGEVVFENGVVQAHPGTGKILTRSITS
jgi:dihydroorotase-like cyclic amidohydrolase